MFSRKLVQPKTLCAGAFVALCGLAFPQTGAEASSFGAAWEMNESQGAAVDSTGNGNSGTLHNVTQKGSYYDFDGSSSYVSVPNSSTLNPGSSNFAMAIRLKLDSIPPNGYDYDVLRKGLAGTAGGDYLFEILDNGRAYCRVRGSSSIVTLRGGPNLANGAWHTIKCAKTSDKVQLSVDGAVAVSKAGTVGSVSNTSALYIGAKPGDDYLNGQIDWARLTVS